MYSGCVTVLSKKKCPALFAGERLRSEPPVYRGAVGTDCRLDGEGRVGGWREGFCAGGPGVYCEQGTGAAQSVSESLGFFTESADF